MSPRRPQEAHNEPQELPRRPKMSPRRLKMSPRSPEEAEHEPQEGTNGGPRVPKREPKERPKIAAPKSIVKYGVSS